MNLRRVAPRVFLLTLACGFPPMADAAENAQTTPREQLAQVANNLDRLPTDWVTTKPIVLEVSFNLKYPPNSPEADAFLRDWYQSISALPDRVQLKVQRMVVPSKYTYLVSLGFDNWQAYRTYESSAGFLAYYVEHWKPAVTGLEERLSIIDPVATAR